MSADKKKVLVIDDEENNRELFGNAFEDCGKFEVLTASDGMEGYRIARQENLEFILTDFRMPKLDGAKLISALRENNLNAATPIIIITGFIEEAKEQCKNEGVFEYVAFLSKPYSPQKLVDQAIRLIESRPKPIDKKDQKIQAQFLLPFIDACTNTLGGMAAVESIETGKPFELERDTDLELDISGVIAIMSNEFKGQLYISFPEKTFLKVAGGMLDEEFTEIDEDIEDAAAEISNIILGGAKKILSEKGYQFQSTLPSVVKGKGHRIRSNGEYPVVVQPFTSASGPYYILICLNENAEARLVDEEAKAAA